MLYCVGLMFERLIEDKKLLDPSLKQYLWLELNEDDSLHGLPLIANPLGKCGRSPCYFYNIVQCYKLKLKKHVN